MEQFIGLNDKEVYTKDFAKEKDLTEFIVLNIEKFCKDILNDELISFELEYEMKKVILKHKKQGICAPRGKRIDLLVLCKQNHYLIEIKRPILHLDNLRAIGQLLNYGREFIDSKKELVLITTKFDINTAKTIEHYNLPIRYIYMDKKKVLEYYGKG